ncbi:hypothetical protein CR513_00899, partial [Mucuna pruriens]
MTSCSKMFPYNPCACNKKVKIADDSLLAIIGIETIKLTPLITFHDVFHVLDLSCNLLSISKITYNHQCQVNFYSSYCVFQKLDTRRMIDNAKEKDELYYFDDESYLSKKCLNTCLSSTFVFHNDDIMLLHYRLGHPMVMVENISKGVLGHFFSQEMNCSLEFLYRDFIIK